jgi:hypothetical protein
MIFLGSNINQNHPSLSGGFISYKIWESILFAPSYLVILSVCGM